MMDAVRLANPTVAIPVEEIAAALPGIWKLVREMQKRRKRGIMPASGASFTRGYGASLILEARTPS